MTAPKWVPLSAIVVIHDRQIARHGGAPGLRDKGLLEAGAARALNAHAYGEEDLFRLAAKLSYGIAKAHAFVDGNKRTAFVAAATFLRLNCFQIRPDALEGVRTMKDLAASVLSEDAFADWLRLRSNPLSAG